MSLKKFWYDQKHWLHKTVMGDDTQFENNGWGLLANKSEKSKELSMLMALLLCLSPVSLVAV